MIKDGIATNTHLYVLETIKKLSRKKGYCYAFNFTLAKMLHITANRVSHVISDLVNAGLLARQLFFNDRGEVVERRLKAIEPKKTTPLVENTKEQTEGVKTNINNGDISPRKSDWKKPITQVKGKAVKMGYELGISIGIVMKQIQKYGLAYVIEKLHIVANSNSAISNVKLFICACRDNYQPSKKATKARDTKPFSVRPSGYNVIVAPAPEAPKAQALTKDNDFVKELMAKFGGKSLGKKLSQIVTA